MYSGRGVGALRLPVPLRHGRDDRKRKGRLKMKKGLQVIILFVAALLGAFSVRGQEIPSVEAQQTPMTGAYAEASKTDKEVIQAANFAIKQAARKNHTSISLVSIENA